MSDGGIEVGNRPQGFVLWLTGFSGAGKSTIAGHLVRLLENRGVSPAELDGDVLRRTISADLGFSKEDRCKQVERAAWVAALLSRNGVNAIASLITPYQEMRDHCRTVVPGYKEVYVRCPISTCIARDVKGLYRKALAGEIDGFTGISDPYEEPVSPDLVVDTDQEAPEQSARRIVAWLGASGMIPPLPEQTYG